MRLICHIFFLFCFSLSFSLSFSLFIAGVFDCLLHPIQPCVFVAREDGLINLFCKKICTQKLGADLVAKMMNRHSKEEKGFVHCRTQCHNVHVPNEYTLSEYKIGRKCAKYISMVSHTFLQRFGLRNSSIFLSSFLCVSCLNMNSCTHCTSSFAPTRAE